MGTADNPSYAAGQITAAAGAAVVAKIQADAMDHATDAQFAIAQQIQDRANQLHAVWAEQYLPCELATLAEVCAEPKQVADLFVTAQRAAVEVTKRFGMARQKALYCMSASCVGARCELEYMLARDQARAEAWQANAAMRAEEARVELANAQRLNNRIAMINPGRGGTAVAANALASAAKIYDGLAQQAAGAFSGALATAGRFLQGAFSGISQPAPQQVPGYTVDYAGQGISPTETQVQARDDLRQFDKVTDPYYMAPLPTGDTGVTPIMMGDGNAGR